ncbi:squamosa promoter-binding protein 15 [Actinosynnema pretiosum]|uniref:Squamosa promoter-binding protein 15 n=1 Tax=Actinosynnema pretiosum TaxID=42197 RepID=A0A290Z7Y7_9PSEU|nr:squamosa promoter-binding protein 15 [Actinosynnema pretiosum]ATE55118.1 squamosa promoter-binding protein 15 [Actinosynnema pretiosum]
MSVVTNVMVSADHGDRESVEDFSEWLETNGATHGGGCGSLAEITVLGDNHWGGPKEPECVVWAGALNHAVTRALLDRFAATPWRGPGVVQLMIMEQDRFYFRLWMFQDGELRQITPEGPPVNDDDLLP